MRKIFSVLLSFVLVFSIVSPYVASAETAGSTLSLAANQSIQLNNHGTTTITLKIKGKMDYVNYNANGGISRWASDTTTSSLTVVAGGKLVITAVDATTLTYEGNLQSTASPNSAITYATLQPNQTIQAINPVDSSIELRMSQNVEYSTYSESKALVRLSTSSTSVQLQKGYEAVITNPQTQAVIVSGPTAVFQPRIMESERAINSYTLKPNDSAIVSGLLMANEVRLNTDDPIDAVVYNSKSGSEDRIELESRSSFNIGVDRYAVVTNSGTTDATIYGAGKYFIANPYGNAALHKVVLNPQQTLEYTNTTGKEVRIYSKQPVDWTRYSATGALETMRTDSSGGISVPANSRIVVTNSKNETAIVYGSAQSFNGAISEGMLANLKKHLTKGSSVLLRNQNTTSITVQATENVDMVSYNENGEVNRQRVSARSIDIPAKGYVIVTNRLYEQSVLTMPYEGVMMETAEQPAFNQYNVKAGERVAFENPSAQSQSVYVEGSSYKVVSYSNQMLIDRDRTYTSSYSLDVPSNGGFVNLENTAAQDMVVLAVPNQHNKTAYKHVLNPTEVYYKYYNKGSNPNFDDFYGEYESGWFSNSEKVEVEKVVLGEPNRSSFVSLPTGSFIVIGFEQPIVNVDGPEIFIEETGKNTVEEATVIAISDTMKEYVLGTAKSGEITSFDFANKDIGMEEGAKIVALWILGMDDGGSSPGFDVVTVKAISDGQKVTPAHSQDVIRENIKKRFEELVSPKEKPWLSGLGLSEEIEAEINLMRFVESIEGDPIDTATGAQFIDMPIVTLSGARDLTFMMHYHSLLLNEGAFGQAWTHNFDASLEQKGNNYIVHWDANKNNEFKRQSDGLYKADNLDGYTLQKKDKQIVVTTKDQEKYIFDASGKLVEHQNRFDQSLFLTYEEDLLKKIEEPISGAHIKIAYKDGNISSITDQGNREIRFTYTDNRLSTINHYNGQRTEFTYNENGQLMSNFTNNIRIFRNTIDSHGRIIFQDDGIAGNTMTRLEYEENLDAKTLTTFVHNRNGAVRELVHNEKRQLLEEKNALGHSLHYTYDSKGNVTSYTDHLGRTHSYTYNENGYLTSETNYDGKTLNYTYDKRGNLLAYNDLNDVAWQLTYNDRNLITSAKSDAGDQMTMVYDKNGQLLSAVVNGEKITYTYNNGMLEAATNNAGQVTTFAYDKLYRLVEMTDANKSTTKMQYNNADLITAMTDGNGHTNYFTYDAFGNLLTVKDASQNVVVQNEFNENNWLVSHVNALKGKTVYEYDGEGNILSVTDELGNKTTYTYDAVGNLSSMQNPNGDAMAMQYDAAGRMTSLTDYDGNLSAKLVYTPMDFIEKITDSLNQLTTFTYDASGSLLSVTDALNQTTSHQYDSSDQLLSTTFADGAVGQYKYDQTGRITTAIDEAGNEIHFTYNPLGKISAITDNLKKHIKLSYDPLGNLVKKVNSRGDVTNYTYDKVGNLIEQTSGKEKTQYTYDKNDLLTAVEKGKLSTAFAYDVMGNLTSYVNEDGQKFAYEYDVAGNLTKVVYPNGEAIQYEYNFSGLLTKVTDEQNRVTTYQYDKNNNLIATIRPNGTVESRTYNQLGQLMGLKDITADGTMIHEQTYAYDAVGNIVENKNSMEQGLNVAFDDKSYLITAYNQIGQYNQNQTAYDADGNMVKAPLNGKMTDFTYDSENRMLTAGQHRFGYDVNGLLSKVTTNGVTKTIVRNPNSTYNEVAMELDKNGKVIRQYVHGDGLIGYTDAEGNYFTYHMDHIGNVIAITDMNGQVTDTYQYEPYGEILSHDGTSTQPFTYIGKYNVMQIDDNFYQMGARFYSADLKRFMNEDPYTGRYNDLSILNAYVYGAGNPFSYIDPDGELPILIPIIAKVVVGTVIRTTAKHVAKQAVKQVAKKAVKKVGQTVAKTAKDGAFGAATNATTEVFSQLALGQEVTWQNVLSATMAGYAGGVAGSKKNRFDFILDAAATGTVETYMDCKLNAPSTPGCKDFVKNSFEAFALNAITGGTMKGIGSRYKFDDIDSKIGQNVMRGIEAPVTASVYSGYAVGWDRLFDRMVGK